MTYTEWLQAMFTILQLGDGFGQTAFTALVPRCIEYAEGRLYRDPELDFLATRLVDLSQTTTTGQRSVAIPANILIIEEVSLITPANTLPTVRGAKRIPLSRTTRAFIDFAYPYESQTQAPDDVNGGHWTPYSMQQASPAPGSADELPVPLPSSVIIAPTVDNQYIVEFTGVFQPAPLSSTNPTTFLTQYLPDLFLAASLVWAFGYQRDFGGQAENPQTAMSWEQTFQFLRQGAAIYELRKKALADGFSALPPRTPTPAQMLAAHAQAGQ